jgi:predicted nucleotidyltransferase
MITAFLTKSAVRRDLLALVFSNPEHQYYQRQLEKLLDHPIALISRELTRLEREGLVRRQKQGNTVLFQANAGHPLFEEVSAIVAKTIGIAHALRTALERATAIRLALIFGSYARYLARERGVDWTAESDVDVLIIGHVDLGDIAQRLKRVEESFQRTVNPTLYGKEEFLRKLQAKDDFLADVLSHAVIPVLGFGDGDVFKPRRLKPDEILERLNEPEGHRRAARP